MTLSLSRTYNHTMAKKKAKSKVEDGMKYQRCRDGLKSRPPKFPSNPHLRRILKRMLHSLSICLKPVRKISVGGFIYCFGARLSCIPPSPLEPPFDRSNWDASSCSVNCLDLLTDIVSRYLRLPLPSIAKGSRSGSGPPPDLPQWHKSSQHNGIQQHKFSSCSPC